MYICMFSPVGSRIYIFVVSFSGTFIYNHPSQTVYSLPYAARANVVSLGNCSRLIDLSKGIAALLWFR